MYIMSDISSIRSSCLHSSSGIVHRKHREQVHMGDVCCIYSVRISSILLKSTIVIIDCFSSDQSINSLRCLKVKSFDSPANALICWYTYNTVKLPAGLPMKLEDNFNFPTTNNKDNKSRLFQKEFGNSFKQNMGSVLNLFYGRNPGLNKVNLACVT